MKQTFLEFEQPIAELQQKIDELRFVHEDSAVDIADEIARLSRKSQQLTKDIYSKLTSWQIAQVARHPQRPYTLDYIAGMFSDFRELHGDRSYAAAASQAATMIVQRYLSAQVAGPLRTSSSATASTEIRRK